MIDPYSSSCSTCVPFIFIRLAAHKDGWEKLFDFPFVVLRINLSVLKCF